MKNIILLVVVAVLGVAGFMYFSSNGATNEAVQGETNQEVPSAAGTGYTEYAYTCSDDATLSLFVGSSQNATIDAHFVKKDGSYFQETLPELPADAGALFEGFGARISAQGEVVTVDYDGEYTCNPVQNPDEAPYNFGD